MEDRTTIQAATRDPKMIPYKRPSCLLVSAPGGGGGGGGRRKRGVSGCGLCAQCYLGLCLLVKN